MSKSLKVRIFETIFSAIFIFMIAAILHKMLYHKEEWMILSVILTISYCVGMFIGKSITTPKDFKELLFLKGAIILLLLIVTIFVTGVVLELEKCWEIVIRIVLPFAIALFINPKKD